MPTPTTTPDDLRAAMAETLAAHFPGAEPTQIGLAVIALRDDVLAYARKVIRETGAEVIDSLH